MTARNHSLGDWFVIIDGILVTEFADGDSISCELMDDDTAVTQGFGGGVIFSHKANNVLEVTITILATSPDNTRIATAVDLYFARRRGSLSLVIQDGRGTTLIESSQMVPKKRAPVIVGTDGGTREWSFYATADTYKVGENEIA